MTEPMIPLNDLRIEATEAAELKAAISRVIDSGWFVSGPEVEAFEREFAVACGVSHCVGVASGTDALILALRALQNDPGRGVATVAVAGGYSSIAIEKCGLTPLYVDIRPDGQMSVASLRHCLDAHDVAAVIITHLYGNAGGAGEIADLCRGIGVPLIEDCAQAHGAITSAGVVGSVGVVGCFSFYPTKNLGALGDGGAVVTRDQSIAERLRSLRNYGWVKDRYVSEDKGATNSRLDEIQAALLRLRLSKLARMNERRRAIARRYMACIESEDVYLDRHAEPHDVFHLFALRSADRGAAREHFHRSGIATAVHYPVPDYQQPRFQAYGDPGTNLEMTSQHCASVLTIPCYPSMSEKDIARVCAALKTEAWR